jgi:hypothetical protein
MELISNPSIVIVLVIAFAVIVTFVDPGTNVSVSVLVVELIKVEFALIFANI